MSTCTLACCFIIIGCIFSAFIDAAEVSNCYTVNSENYCFYASDTILSWNEARDFCARINSTLPIIKDENINKVFQRFIDSDSHSVIQNSSVWLDAQARLFNDSVTWHWIDGGQSALTSSDFLDHADNKWYASVGVDGGRPALYENYWRDSQHYICQYDWSSVNCSPRWRVYHNSRALDAWQTSATTQQQCLDACVADYSCVTVEWSSEFGCWVHDRHRQRVQHAGVTQFELVSRCDPKSDTSCDDAFQWNSYCYKVHKNERVPWFTAVNSCVPNNASLAVFDDNVRQYFPSSVLSEQAWIGLLKSRWIWPDGTDVLYNKFNVDSSSPPDNPLQHPNSDYSCVVATTGPWKLVRCDERHLVVCQSDHLLPVTTTTPATTTAVATETTEVSATVGLIIGLVAVCVVAAIVVVVVVVVVLRRRRSRSSSDKQQHHRHPQQQQQLRQQQNDGEEDKSTDIYVNGDIVTEPRRDDVGLYAHIVASPQSADDAKGEVVSSNIQNDNEPVIYSELQSGASNDLYANVL